tara:strand:+ start:932 stop:1312 length:381 start_codon:yes stop_codon:yes gene_type:complete
MNPSLTIPLTGDAEAHGEKITSITLRPPVGKDFVTCGYPMIMISPDEAMSDTTDQAEMSGAGEFRPNAGAIAKLISRLGNVPYSTVSNLNAMDFNACMMGVLSFLGETKPAKPSSPPVSTSRAVGA